MKIEVGMVVHFNGQGKYEVISQKEGSRTLFTIKDIDRGAGWDEERRKYVGVNVEGGWYLGKNAEYGNKSEVHKDSLSVIKNENL
jgi:hypothetical protein